MMNKLYSVLTVFLFMFVLVSVAHAQSVLPAAFGGSISDFTKNILAESDPIVSQDAAQYQQFDLAGKFGLAFHSHKQVCDGSDEVHCNARVTTDAQGSPLASATTPAGYSPAQLLKAYNLTGTASGHPIIAIVDAYDDPNITTDLATYSARYHLPALPTCAAAIASSNVACFKKVNQQGKTTSLPSQDAGWSLEISLDVEVAHATCQNCSILLVEANSASYASLGTAVNEAVALGANAVSNSYGGSEFSSETSYDTYYNHPGVAITVSAGDSGYGVEYPAASQYVTAVGGTTLLLNADGSYNEEMAWSGTGSGCSAYESKPSSQKDTGCTRRTVADVSADADPNTGAAVYDSVRYYGSRGWFEVGGTSLASPLVAAVYALSGHLPQNTLENTLPYLATGSLHDITLGSNGSCSVPYLCEAGAGYDGPTGLGSPDGVGAF